MRDIGRLRRPGRDGAGARRNNEESLGSDLPAIGLRTVSQQFDEQFMVLTGCLACIFHEVDEMRLDIDLPANIAVQ